MDILEQRFNIQEEETDFESGVSEGAMTRMGAAVNFINKRQTDIKEFKLNGNYRVATDIGFYDGAACFFGKSKIVALYIYNGFQGLSGITEFDLCWIDQSGVDQGSIFSTKPTIDYTAVNNSIGFENYITTTLVEPVGVDMGVISKTEFLEGESVYLKLTDAMVGARNCGLTFFYIPIS